MHGENLKLIEHLLISTEITSDYNYRPISNPLSTTEPQKQNQSI